MQTKTKRVQNRGTPRASCPTNGQNCAFSDSTYIWGKFSLEKEAQWLTANVARDEAFGLSAETRYNNRGEKTYEIFNDRCAPRRL